MERTIFNLAVKRKIPCHCCHGTVPFVRVPARDNISSLQSHESVSFSALDFSALSRSFLDKHERCWKVLELLPVRSREEMLGTRVEISLSSEFQRISLESFDSSWRPNCLHNDRFDLCRVSSTFAESLIVANDSRSAARCVGSCERPLARGD